MKKRKNGRKKEEGRESDGKKRIRRRCLRRFCTLIGIFSKGDPMFLVKK